MNEPTYEELDARVRALGLYKRTYGRYTLFVALAFLGVGLSVYILTLSDSLLVQTLNALFFSFALVQVGTLSHDLSHNQVFTNKRVNKLISKIVFGLMAGLSESLWHKEHSAHHEHVNQEGHDPDLTIPFLFSPNQSREAHAAPDFMLKHQHIVFFCVLPIVYTSKVIRSWLNVPEHIGWYLFELVLVAVHFAVLLYMVMAYLPLTVSVTFLLVHVLCVGLYMGTIFAPNHKGEEVLRKDEQVTWRHQITSTRNVQHTPFVFIIMGGLNLQIEHHLFPRMSRYQYSKAQKVVKAFCCEHDIRYHETTFWGSMKEIYGTLKGEARAHTGDR